MEKSHQKEKAQSEEVEKKELATPWFYNSFFQYALGILLILCILLVFYKVSFFLNPIVQFISILFAPIAISMLFYYLLRPIVYFFEQYNVPRIVTILGIYLIIALVLLFFFAFIGPILSTQIKALADSSVVTFEKLSESSRSMLLRWFNVDLNHEIEQSLFSIVQQITTSVSKNLGDFIAFFTKVATTLAVIPFIVFYLLKDDKDFSTMFLENIPEDFAVEIRKTLRNMDATLSNYITGLVLVSCIVGGMLFIGYTIIGLNYALLLSLIAIIFMTIPFLGPFLSIAPAIFVAMADSSMMVLKTAIVFIIVQQCEANLLSPQIIGQRLNIHPLTIILLLLAAGFLYGLPGLILATPLYALGKVLVENVYKIVQWHWTIHNAKKSEEQKQ